MAGTVASVVRFVQLRDDPRPWKQKAGALAGAFALSGLQGAAIGVVALAVRDQLNEFVANQFEDIAVQLGMDGDGLGILFGGAAGIGAAVVLRTGIRSVQELRAGANIRQVGADAAQQLLIMGAEQVAFILLGLVLDSVTPIPDPIIAGTISVLRIAYSLTRFGLRFKADMDSKVACTEKRIDAAYELAASVLVTA